MLYKYNCLICKNEFVNQTNADRIDICKSKECKFIYRTLVSYVVVSERWKAGTKRSNREVKITGKKPKKFVYDIYKQVYQDKPDDGRLYRDEIGSDHIYHVLPSDKKIKEMYDQVLAKKHLLDTIKEKSISIDYIINTSFCKPQIFTFKTISYEKQQSVINTFRNHGRIDNVLP